jgi:hypothetical protein
MSTAKYDIVKGVLLRALRAFIAGFVGTAATIALTNITTWTELGTALAALTLSGVIGGITAVLMAADKYFRSA